MSILPALRQPSSTSLSSNECCEFLGNDDRPTQLPRHCTISPGAVPDSNSAFRLQTEGGNHGNGVMRYSKLPNTDECSTQIIVDGKQMQILQQYTTSIGAVPDYYNRQDDSQHSKRHTSFANYVMLYDCGPTLLSGAVPGDTCVKSDSFQDYDDDIYLLFDLHSTSKVLGQSPPSSADSAGQLFESDDADAASYNHWRQSVACRPNNMIYVHNTTKPHLQQMILQLMNTTQFCTGAAPFRGNSDIPCDYDHSQILQRTFRLLSRSPTTRFKLRSLRGPVGNIRPFLVAVHNHCLQTLFLRLLTVTRQRRSCVTTDIVLPYLGPVTHY